MHAHTSLQASPYAHVWLFLPESDGLEVIDGLHACPCIGCCNHAGWNGGERHAPARTSQIWVSPFSRTWVASEIVQRVQGRCSVRPQADRQHARPQKPWETLQQTAWDQRCSEPAAARHRALHVAAREFQRGQPVQQQRGHPAASCQRHLLLRPRRREVRAYNDLHKSWFYTQSCRCYRLRRPFVAGLDGWVARSHLGYQGAIFVCFA